jgi:hypothetical protein
MDTKLRISAEAFGINLHNFGKDKQWQGYFTKNSEYINELSKLREQYTHVLGVDARDVLFMDGLDSILKEYNEHYYNKLVFNGEDCDGLEASYDNALTTERDAYINYRPSLPYKSTGKYKYLNSGCFIGPIDTLIHSMEKAFRFKDKWGGNWDQGPMEEVYMTSHNMVVDEECRIFQILSENEAGGVNFDLIYKEGKPHNRRYETNPKILHGAGHSLMVQPWRILTGNYY